MGKFFINSSVMEVYRIWKKWYRQQEEMRLANLRRSLHILTKGHNFFIRS